MFQDEVVEQLHLPAVLTRELKITAFYSAGPGSLVYLDIYICLCLCIIFRTPGGVYKKISDCYHDVHKGIYHFNIQSILYI